MPDAPASDSSRSLERPAYGALWAFLLAPVMAQGLWRPLLHFGGAGGRASAMAITIAALGVCGAIVIARQIRPGPRSLAPWALGGLFAVGATLVAGLGLSGLLCLLAVAASLSFLLHRLSPGLPGALDGLARRHKVLFALYAAGALLSIVKTAQLSVFMGDATRPDLQVLPGVKFIETHSCLSAYVQADRLARERVENLYDPAAWLGSHGQPPRPAGAEDPYRPFVLDYYAYPPPFLLAMAPLAIFAGDFAAQRALWFGVNGLLLAVGLWLVARWLDGPGGHRVLLLAPLFFASLPILAVLQVGNFQTAVVVLAVLAMVAFQREQNALGGALLAFVVLSKLSPALLGVVLLAQRRYRAVAWTAGFGVFFVALSVLSLGVNPLTSFLTYTLPRLSSGETFSFMDDDPFSILTNMAPFGLPFKLQLLGVPISDPWRVGRLIGRVYSGILVLLTLVAVRRVGDRRSQAIVWMSLLVLGALQSPFAPGYVQVGLLWATTLLAVEVRSLRAALGLVLLWIVINLLPPASSPNLMAIDSLLQSLLSVGVPVGLILRSVRRENATTA